MTTKKSATFQYMAEPFHCDFTHHLFMAQLGNHMLNAAELHASERGFGMAQLAERGMTWVLSRLAVEMRHMPRQLERFAVETWIESAMRSFTNRNFRVTDDNGQALGYGRSTWALIDTDSRRPLDVQAVADGNMSQWADAQHECPIDKCSRVMVGANARLADVVQTHYADVDVNGHINSIKYVEHALNLFPLQWHADHRLLRFEVAYVAESHGGDSLALYCDEADPLVRTVRVMRRQPGNDGEVEACRCKFVFE